MYSEQQPFPSFVRKIMSYLTLQIPPLQREGGTRTLPVISSLAHLPLPHQSHLGDKASVIIQSCWSLDKQMTTCSEAVQRRNKGAVCACLCVCVGGGVGGAGGLKGRLMALFLPASTLGQTDTHAQDDNNAPMLRHTCLSLYAFACYTHIHTPTRTHADPLLVAWSD